MFAHFRTKYSKYRLNTGASNDTPGDSPYVYTITLRREDSLLFRGEWSAGKASDRDSGACSCRLYSNGDRIAFIGVWKQKGGTEHWFAEFTSVERIEA